MNCQHIKDPTRDTLCPVCMSLVKANTISETQREAYRREGDKRTVERIVLLLCRGMSCVSENPGGKDRSCPHSDDDCYQHWLEYLAPEEDSR